MINEGVCVEVPGVLRLVPYLPCHVARYHEWMCNPSLLAATESELLTLDEERENQDSWLRSMEKLTFIITLPVSRVTAAVEAHRHRHQSTAEESATTAAVPTLRRVDPAVPAYERGAATSAAAEDNAGPSAHLSGTNTAVAQLPARYVLKGAVDAFTGKPVVQASSSSFSSSLVPSLPSQARGAAPAEPHVMVGDCNLFVLDAGELDVAQGGATNFDTAANEYGNSHPHHHQSENKIAMERRVFEVEVMVAESRLRRMGIATTAVRMLMQYAVRVLGATHFVAKILESNAASIDLFTRQLGFTELKRVNVFHEIHYVRSLASEEKRSAWRQECGKLFICAPFTEEMKENTMSF